MKKIVFCLCILFFCQAGGTSATELVDTLSRTFKKIQSRK